VAQGVVEQIGGQAFDQAGVAVQWGGLQGLCHVYASGPRLEPAGAQHVFHQHRQLDGFAREHTALHARQRHERVDQLLLLLPRGQDPLMSGPQ
jgi:hypothetical protein